MIFFWFVLSTLQEEAHSAQSSTSREVHQSGSDDHFRQLSAGHLSKDSLNVGDSRSLSCLMPNHLVLYCG